MGQRILMVDDEPRILDGFRRSLRGSYEIVTATSGAEALDLQRKALAEDDPFPVIVSDMMMPEMNGAEFLTQARAVDGDAVRMILSGQADLASTITAVNHANLFRFLTKPVEPPDLTRALDDALEQHRLVRAERDLLDRTLRGAVDMLTELLSMAAPEAFSRTTRVRTLVEAAAAHSGLTDDWRLPIAAALSQVGCIAIPGPVMRQVESGVELAEDEETMYRDHPGLAQELLERVPRLEDVARWIGRQPLTPGGSPAEDAEPAEGLLHAATAFLSAYEVAGTAGKAAAQMKVAAKFPEPLIDAMRRAALTLAPSGVERAIEALEVRPGMILEQDVLTVTGMTLARRGDRLNETLALRVQNFARSVGIVEPLVVLEGA
jgi:CheY-like chemotaxis protein